MAKVIRMAPPDIPPDVLLKVKGRVQLRAVFCASGKVTDIAVIRSLPDGAMESVIQGAEED
jgi:hypothetical protein